MEKAKNGEIQSSWATFHFSISAEIKDWQCTQSRSRRSVAEKKNNSFFFKVASKPSTVVMETNLRYTVLLRWADCLSFLNQPSLRLELKGPAVTCITYCREVSGAKTKVWQICCDRWTGMSKRIDLDKCDPSKKNKKNPPIIRPDLGSIHSSQSSCLCLTSRRQRLLYKFRDT